MKPRPKHQLRIIHFNVLNLPPWEIYYCQDCDEAWSRRHFKITDNKCPREIANPL
jgi:hypothetical protein